METIRKNVFMVDDDMTILTIGRNVLSEKYNVFTMNSGDKMMKMIKKTTPDLVLLDVEMPEMSGYEVMKAMKAEKETEGIPVIFLTAKDDVESVRVGQSLGAAGYIIKPFSPPDLIRRLEQFFAGG